MCTSEYISRSETSCDPRHVDLATYWVAMCFTVPPTCCAMPAAVTGDATITAIAPHRPRSHAPLAACMSSTVVSPAYSSASQKGTPRVLAYVVFPVPGSPHITIRSSLGLHTCLGSVRVLRPWQRLHIEHQLSYSQNSSSQLCLGIMWSTHCAPVVRLLSRHGTHSGCSVRYRSLASCHLWSYPRSAVFFRGRSLFLVTAHFEHPSSP